MPIFIDLYWINWDFWNSSFEMDLPLQLHQQEIHPIFHSSLLWVHMLNNNHLFLGRIENQVANFGKIEPEWTIDCVISHCKIGADANLQVRWTSRDLTWVPYSKVCHLSKVFRVSQVSRCHGCQGSALGKGKTIQGGCIPI